MHRTRRSAIRLFNTIIVGCLMSHLGYAADLARIAISVPSVEAGEIDAMAFADRLATAFASDDRHVVQVLERATDKESAQKLAQREGYDFLLTTSIRSKKITGLSAITQVLGVTKKGKEERWRVGVAFVLHRVDGGAVVLNQTDEESEGPAEQTVIEVATKVAELVAAAIHEPVPAEAIAVAETTATLSDDSQSGSGTNSTAPRLVVQTSHTASVVDFVYSPDGVVLATLGADGVVKIWNTSSGKEIDTYAGYPITGVAFHPSRNWLAGIGSDNVVRIFDIPSGELIRQLTPLKGRKKDESSMGGMFAERVPIAFAESEDLLVHGGKTSATVWSVASGARVRTFKSKGGASVLAISPDGNKVVTVVDDSKLYVYSVATGKNIEKIDAMVTEVTALAFAPDNKMLIVGSRNGSVRLFDVDRGREVGKPPLLDKCDAVEAISKTIGLVGGFLKKSVIGDIADLGKQAVDVCETFSAVGAFADQGMMGFMTRSVRSLAMMPGGDLLAYSLGDNTVRVIDMDSRAPLYEITPSLKVKFAESAEIPSGKLDEPGTSVAAWGFMFQAPVKFSRNGDTLDTVGNFKTVARWDARSGTRLSSLAVSQRDSSFGMPFPLPRASVPVFGEDGRTLLTATLTGGTRLWDLESGLPPELVSQASAIFNNPPVNSQGTLVVTTERGDEGPRMVVREIGSGLEVQQFDLPNVDSDQNMFFEAPATFSPDGHSLAIQTFENDGVFLRVYDLKSGKTLFEQRGVLHVDFGADGRHLAMLGDMGRRKSKGRQELRIVDTIKWKTVFDERIVATNTAWMTAGFALSAASDYVAAIDGTNIRIWKVDDATPYRQRTMPVGGVSHMVFNPADDSLTFTGQRALMHWNIHADTLRTSTLQTDFWGNLSYNADGELLALGGASNQIRLFDVVADVEIASVVAPNQDDWLVITPDGRLDTRWLDEVEEVHWVVPDDPLRTQPLELFMREYFEPTLLARLIKGESFQDLPQLENRNRALPEVTITSVSAERDHSIDVRVTVQETQSATQHDAAGQPLRSGASGLRLFRDGRMVHHAPAGLGALSLDENGLSELAFNVQLPRDSALTEIELSAYAFNEDGVKSSTARHTYNREIQQPPTIKKSGRAYIIAIGVNETDNPGFKLRYAANDARLISQVLKTTLEDSGRYADVVTIPLISEALAVDATTVKIRAVLDRLAGKANNANALAGIPGASQLRKAKPDDMVVITYAGHGYTDVSGIFHFVPSDIGSDTGTDLAGLVPRLLSSKTLSEWLLDVDAGEMLMVIDACYSASIVEGQDFKPGPLGAKSLGQLSYDKGMRVLTATQVSDVALELDEIEHGLLTFALVAQGLVERKADFRPVDQVITTAEWLRYGVKHTSDVYEAIRDGRLSVLEDGRKVGGERSVIRFGERQERRQQPVLFDFNRMEDAPPLVSLAGGGL